MILISKENDFYDYVVLANRDPKYVLDRRQASTITAEKVFKWFDEKIDLTNYSYFIDLRVGFTVYTLKIIGYQVTKEWKPIINMLNITHKFDYELVETKHITEKREGVFGIEVRSVYGKGRFAWHRQNYKINGKMFIIRHFAKYLDAYDIYRDIYNYLISVKEEKDPQSVNEKTKLEQHGFDKNSFKRNKRK